jgi:type 1 glutamine amidotransferase
MFGLARGSFIMHPEGNPPVYCCALADAAHPAAAGLASFEAPDEHYFCLVDVEKTKPFLCSRSAAGTEIAGWAHQRGKGRVCCLTPGHTEQMVGAMRPHIAGAVRWCVRD